MLLLSSDSTARLAERTHRVMDYYCVYSHGETLASPTTRLLLSLAMASRPATESEGTGQAGDRASVCSRSLGKPPARGTSTPEQSDPLAVLSQPRT